MSARDAAFPVVVVGHVDHGKSTLVGRLLHDTGSLPPGRVERLRAESAKRGLDLEWSFLLDSLQLERDQGITLDTAQIWFQGRDRRYAILDAPGHAEFLRNMVTGAAQAEAAVLVLDAEQGLGEQTRRHLYLLSLLGVGAVVVAVNKMDRVGWDAARFAALREEVAAYLSGLGLRAAAVVPLSAKGGDFVVARGTAAPWHDGPTLLEALDDLPPRPRPVALPLRLPVQEVLRRGEERLLLGRLAAGRIAEGDAVVLHPGGQRARVLRLERWGEAPRPWAEAGESVAVRLDCDVFAARGQVLGAAETPPAEARALSARLFWLDPAPLALGERITLRLGTAEVQAAVEAIESVVDVQALTDAPAARLERNGIARVRLRALRPLALDLAAAGTRLGRGVLARGGRIAGGFVVEALEAAAPVLVPVATPLTAAERLARDGQRGAVLWLTGLSGAGKSTLGAAAVRALAARGIRAALLDGDTLRLGLNAGLGFGDADRAENIRRTAEAAKLLADAGVLAIVAVIAPLAAHRGAARAILGSAFHEVHVHADLALCEARDPKGLYARARAGEIAGFTGVSAPYEAPEAPALRLDTGALGEGEALAALLALAEEAAHG